MDQAFLYCVGATKAGTSWLYRTLADRPDVALSAVKETHFWDTRDPDARRAQIEAFERQLRRFGTLCTEAEERGQGWKVANMSRRMADMNRLIAMMQDGSEEAYLNYVTAPAVAETRLVGDICPAYGLLSTGTLSEMLGAVPEARFLYLIREPVSRLWSAVRMQADRQLQPGQTVEQKAHNILHRVLNKGVETHLTARGDYAGTVARLRAVVPAEQLRVMYMEELVTDAGYASLCGWLGLPEVRAPVSEKVHEGQAIVIRPDLAEEAARQLASQYAFAEAEVGPLPDAWRARA
ncbi:MAG: sulfotransferase [Rhodobacteraceae bacterium]|nr:sulfotransferase [Paracoccaceae bacterium]